MSSRVERILKLMGKAMGGPVSYMGWMLGPGYVFTAETARRERAQAANHAANHRAERR